jgi:hypothetical protein
MKKLILIAAGLSISFMGVAQKKNVTSAIMAMGNDEYDEAKKAIDEAVVNESTKDDPKAWFIRGEVYNAMIDKNKIDKATGLEEMRKSYMKVAELKPDYNKEDINNRLVYNVARQYFNLGIENYNAKKYPDAVAAFKVLTDMHNMENGKRFAGNKAFDTTVARADLYGAYAAFYGENYDLAEVKLNEVKANPIVSEANVYLMLLDIAKRKNNDAAVKTVLDEARKAYPSNDNLRREELNYYVKQGKADELTRKLEEGIAAEKDNTIKAELYFNLGNAYLGQAFPKGPKPANYADLTANAEAAYTSALAINGEQPEYQYNMGALYYNQATEFNSKMNAIEGSSAADIKKIDAFKAERNAMFNKALPYMEKTYALLEKKGAEMTPDDKQTYLNAATNVYTIYATLDNQAKATEWKKKKDAIR